jgi:predicted MFS family arabinose efflux permease
MVSGRYAWFFFAGSLGPIFSMALRFVPAQLERLGASPSLVGDVMAASTLGGFIALPVVGMLTSRHLRAVLVVGAGLQALGLWLASYGAHEVGILAVAVGLMSTGTAALDVGVTTAVVSTVPPERRAELLAHYFTLVSLARNVVGSALAEQLVIHGGFATMAWVLAVGAGLHAVVRTVMPIPEPPAREAGPGLGAFARALGRPRTVLLLVAFVLLGTNFAAQESFLTALAASRELGAVTPFFMAYFVVVAVGRVAVGNRVDRLGRGTIVIVSGLVLAGLAAGLAVVGSRGGLMALGVLSGLGHLLVWPALYATFYDEVPDRSMVSAMLCAALAAAGFAAELGLGRLAGGPAYAATYWGAAACALAASCLVLPLWRSMDRGRWRGS